MTRLAVPRQLTSDEPIEPVTRSLQRGLRVWLDEDNLDGLSDALEALPVSEAVADDLQGLLADERLTAQARDARGRAVRVLAVAALMRMGFPHALKVDPEDLVLLRHAEGRPPARAFRTLTAVLALVPLVAGGGGAVAALLSKGFDLFLLPLIFVGLLVAGCGWKTLSATRHPAAETRLKRAGWWSLSLYAAFALLGVLAGAYWIAATLAPLALSGLAALATSRALGGPARLRAPT